MESGKKFACMGPLYCCTFYFVILLIMSSVELKNFRLYTCCAVICEQKPQKLLNKNVMRFWRQFQDCSSPVIARTPPQSGKGKCPVAEQLFGVCSIRIHHIVFEYCMSEKEERCKMNKIDIFTFGFFPL